MVVKEGRQKRNPLTLGWGMSCQGKFQSVLLQGELHNQLCWLGTNPAWICVDPRSPFTHPCPTSYIFFLFLLSEVKHHHQPLNSTMAEILAVFRFHLYPQHSAESLYIVGTQYIFAEWMVDWLFNSLKINYFFPVWLLKSKTQNQMGRGSHSAFRKMIVPDFPQPSVHLRFLKLRNKDPRDHDPPNVFQQKTLSLVVSFQRMSPLGLIRKWCHMRKRRQRGTGAPLKRPIGWLPLNKSECVFR